jgi:hypothetical protein
MSTTGAAIQSITGDALPGVYQIGVAESLAHDLPTLMAIQFGRV